MAKHWKERFGKGGVCDFQANYDYFFKWLLSKTCSCFYISGLPETLDEFYIKSNLICDGFTAITDFNGSLYAILGAPGGKPDEYYKPTIYTASNPVLGSKTVEDGVNGVILYNTPLDAYVPGGLYGLITQTATLLADNIVSINCCQINGRVSTIITVDGDGQAIEAESTMKNIYAGKPFKVLRSDLVEKITVNPVATAHTANILAQLIELHNYIVANYFQSIGIRANNIRKKSHVLQDEIDVQNEFLQISIYEIMTSWQKGFDKVNEMYGTDIHVHINPALLSELEESQETEPNPVEEHQENEPESVEESQESEPEPVEEPQETEPEPMEEPQEKEPDPVEEIEEKENELSDIIDLINDKEKDGEEDA